MDSSGQRAGKDHPFSPPERFQVKRKIGEGGMGAVYEAWDRDNNVRVALKTGRTREPESLTYFKTEFRSLTEVVHNNLICLYEMISAGDQWFFSMEYVDGMDCLSWIRGNERLEGRDETATETLVDSKASSSEASRRIHPPLSSAEQFARLRQVLTQITQGLQCLHSFGKLHCDIKPSNIHLTKEGRVVILDFGLVHDATQHLWTRRKRAGTPGYMSPEQALGEHLSPAADWFSVGVMLLEAILGHRSTEQERLNLLADLPPSLPADLERICTGLLAIDPDSRLNGDAILQLLHSESGPPAPIAHQERGGGGLIGREAELAALEQVFGDTEKGDPATVFLHSASGMGKSELCRQFARAASDRPDTLVVTGKCYEQESVPFKAVDGVADALGSWLKGLDGETALACEPRHSAALARIFPVLSHKAFHNTGREPELDPVELRRRAFGAFRELLARIGDHKRLVIIIDDLQWSDLDSTALLHEILRPPDSPALMLILCFRTEDRSCPWVTSLLEANLPGKKEIHLLPFSREKALDLAGRLINRDDPEWQSRAATIADECGGSPYLVMELAQHLGTQKDRSSLDDVLWQRIEVLPVEARSFLEVVCVAARSVQRKDAFTAASLQAHDPAVISLLRGNRLLRAGPSGEDSVETYHDRIRETVIARISKDRLRLRHENLAHTLEDSGGADPEQLAFHYDRADEKQKAFHYYVQGGDAAAAALAFDRAAQLFSRSLELIEQGVQIDGTSRGTLLISLARSFANAGRGREAATTFELAARETQDRSEALSLRQQAAYQYSISGYLSEGREVFRDVLKAVGRKLPPAGLRIVPLLAWANLRFRCSSVRYREPAPVPAGVTSRADTVWFAAIGFGMVDLIGGAYFSDIAAIDALRCGDPHRLLRSLAWRACVICNRGAHMDGEVGKLLGVCDDILKRHPSPYGEAMVELARGITEFHFDRQDQVLKHLLTAEEIFVAKCTGTYWERTTARVFICFTLQNQGRLAELKERADALLRDSRERGDRYTYAMLGTGIAHVPHLAADRPAEARTAVDDALAGWKQEGITVPKIYAMWASHQIHSYRDEKRLQLPEVESFMAETRGSLISRIEAFRMGFLATRSRGALGLAEEGIRVEENLELAEGEAKRVLKLRLLIGRAFAHGLIAGVKAARGDRQGAIESLRLGIQILETDNRPYYSVPMRMRMGQLINSDAGVQMEHEAVAWMRGIGVVHPYRFSAMYVSSMPRLARQPKTLE